jgi:hypothetical protein
VNHYFAPTLSASPPHPFADAFWLGLHAFGYSDGENIKVEFRYTDGRSDRAEEYAEELVRLSPDVIVAHYALAVSAAMAATRTIPIVMAPHCAPFLPETRYAESDDVDIAYQLRKLSCHRRDERDAPAQGLRGRSLSTRLGRMVCAARMTAQGQNRKLPISKVGFRSAPKPAVRLSRVKRIEPTLSRP